MTTIAILSGGIDSTCAASVTRATSAVTFDYGQRHRREIDAARRVAEYLNIRWQVFGLPDILSKSALLGDADIPHGRYDDPSMKITVVHGRNLLFVATAIAAVTRPGDKLVTGVHAGDHPIYPDCRPRFWAAVRLAAEAYNISIITPFIRMDKAGVIKAGHAAGAPVGITWSCYEGMSVHCGKCGTCTERIEAFKLAGINDPTIYDKEA